MSEVFDLKKFFKGFGYAARGLAGAVRDERNMRIHTCMVFYVIIAGIITKISRGEWFAVLLCCALVLGMETMNTAVENLCDALHPEKSRKIGFVKDAAAGAVLVCAIFSAIIGCAVFFKTESLENVKKFACEHTAMTIIIACTVVPAIMFIHGRKKNDN